jgi:hypothetical protein
VIEHLGGNVYVTVDNNDKTDCCVDIRYHWCSPTDYKRYLKPQGLFVTFEQFDKLKKCLNWFLKHQSIIHDITRNIGFSY